jgi:enolase
LFFRLVDDSIMEIRKQAVLLRIFMGEHHRYGVETFHALKTLLTARGLSTAIGDGGGICFEFEEQRRSDRNAPSGDQTCWLPSRRRRGDRAGPGRKRVLSRGRIRLCQVRRRAAQQLWNGGALSLYLELVDHYPIVSLEDGMAEDDIEGWMLFTKTLGRKIQLVGDVVFVTNSAIFARGIERGVANAILIKLNQIGTLTETLETVAIAKKGKLPRRHQPPQRQDGRHVHSRPLGSHRLWAIRTGSLCRSERVAKYNQLLTIERELGRERASFGFRAKTV